MKRGFILSIVFTLFITACFPKNNFMNTNSPNTVMETEVTTPSPSATVTLTVKPSQTITPTGYITPTIDRTKFPYRSKTPTPTETFTITPYPTFSGSKSIDSLTKTCLRLTSEIRTIREQNPIPDHFLERDFSRQEGDFDPNLYFDLFDHLSLNDGYTLEYVYFGDHLGGKPLLYALPDGQIPYQDYESYLNSIGDEVTDERSYNTLNHAYDFLNYIELDDTEESYLQMIIFALLADQFYLSWHALYNDTQVLCAATDYDFVHQEIESYNHLETIPEDMPGAAHNIDYLPTVTKEDDKAIVSFILFTKWGGFFRQSFSIARTYPHTIYYYDSEQLFEYDCGITF